MSEFRHFINGEFENSENGRTFEDRDPVDNSLIGLVQEGGQREVDEAVRAARVALRGPWGSLGVEDRAALLNRVADAIEARFDDFLAAECRDTGKPQALASKIDIPRGAANFRAFADVMSKQAEERFRMDTPDGGGAINYSHRSPKGVIAVICPWNLPLLLLTFKVGPALACGNAVVVKPSEETPATATLLGEVMNECGVPPGVFNVIHGLGPESAGEYLTRHPDIDAITFTGETRTGEVIMRAASVGLRNISMECGGKNPALVFTDCDVEKAIEGTLRSVFLNTGQVCLCTERVYVQRPLFDEFVTRLSDGARGLRAGRPADPDTDFGPLISLGHREKVLWYYGLAREEGAEVVTGGGIPEMGDGLGSGAWIEPTIWTGLDNSARVVREEIFGPCCHIQPFDEEDEAIALANDTDYGLAASVWTESSSRAARVAESLEVGIAWVNSWFLRDLRTAFGGAKQSGIGREGGVHGLDFYTELKNVCVKL